MVQEFQLTARRRRIVLEPEMRDRIPFVFANLGLAIAKRALELHGSEIRVGAGSDFAFRLRAHAG